MSVSTTETAHLIYDRQLLIVYFDRFTFYLLLLFFLFSFVFSCSRLLAFCLPTWLNFIFFNPEYREFNLIYYFFIFATI